MPVTPRSRSTVRPSRDTVPLAAPPRRAPAADASTLASALADAAARPRPAAEALDALARLDPRAAAAWLAEADAGSRGLLSPGERAAVLDALARRAAAGDAPLAEACADAAARDPDALTPAAAAALAAALPADRRADAEAMVARLLDRSPAHAALLRAAAELAVAAGDAPRAHALLTRLGHADPSPATVGWVMRARAGLAPADGVPARVAVLSSFTIDPLRPFLDLSLRAAGMRPDIHVGGFNAWERGVRDPRAALRAFAPDVVFLAIALDDLVPALAGPVGADALREMGGQAIDRIASAVAALRGWTAAPVIVHALASGWPDPAGPAGSRGADGRASVVAGLNARLAGRLFDHPDVYVLDVLSVLARADGAPEDPRLRHLARMRLGPRVLPELALAYAGYVAPAKGLTRKCVVVDLDNTLWGGVVGEDGVGGIRLGEQAPGSEFVELQRWLAGLRDRGILLAIASKNNPDDALAALRGHDAMVLREGDFAAMRIGWRPKHEGVTEIAAELGIGTDAMVFIDDNPDERALMRRMLPEVLTPELPADPARYRIALERLPQLQSLRVTGEDRGRADAYGARRAREAVRASSSSMDDYLRSLDLRAAAGPASAASLPRIAQLFQRTNQFNLTTRRHDAGVLAARAADPRWRLFALRAGDRFADHGLVGAALARIGEDGGWTVESLLLSCRAIGFGLETALLAAVAEAARESGAETMAGEFVPTGRNRPAEDFWARHGFTRASVDEDGTERWARALADGALAVPAWITREEA